MKVQYSSKKPINLGDLVSYGGNKCLVMFDEYNPNYPIRLIKIEDSQTTEGFRDLESLRDFDVELLCKAENLTLVAKND